jgi:hypothetical protein
VGAVTIGKKSLSDMAKLGSDSCLGYIVAVTDYPSRHVYLAAGVVLSANERREIKFEESLSDRGVPFTLVAPSGMQIANGFLVGGHVHLLKGYHQLQPSRNSNESNYRIKP